MNITLAMIWDIVNRTYPELETTLYGNHPVRGIKLRAREEPVSAEYLYAEQRGSGLFLTCGGQSAHLDTELPLEALFNAMLDAYNGLRDWDQATHVALLENCGVEELLTISEDILGNPVTFLDPSYKLLASTASDNNGSEIFSQVSQRGYLPAEVVEDFAQQGFLKSVMEADGEIAHLAEASIVCVSVAIRAGGAVAGFLSMPCTNRLYSEGLAECYRYLAEGVTICMERQFQAGSANRQMYEYVLIDLIEGKLNDGEALSERLRYIDLPENGKFHLLILSGHREKSLGRYLVRQTADRLPNERVFFYQDQVAVLLHSGRLEWVLSALEPFLAEQDLVCGISRGFTYIQDVSSAYRQAVAAIRLGCTRSGLRTLEKLSVEGLLYEDRFFHYERYSPYHVVEGAAKAEMISPHIHRLIALDRQDGTDHLRVLYGFLTHERRPTQTAEALHMHRNNVIYRVDRIEKLLGVSLDDAILRRELQLSLLILELTEYG